MTPAKLAEIKAWHAKYAAACREQAALYGDGWDPDMHGVDSPAQCIIEAERSDDVLALIADHARLQGERDTFSAGFEALQATCSDWQERSNAAEAEASRLRSQLAEALDWKPTAEAPERPGVYISVRSVTSYRWLAYKPDGARQMKRAGRWQRCGEYGGWDNAELPEVGEWQPHPAWKDARAIIEKEAT